jgi:hypothetical protein
MIRGSIGREEPFLEAMPRYPVVVTTAAGEDAIDGREGCTPDDLVQERRSCG